MDGFSACPHYGYQVEVFVHQSDGTPLAGAQVRPSIYSGLNAVEQPLASSTTDSRGRAVIYVLDSPCYFTAVKGSDLYQSPPPSIPINKMAHTVNIGYFDYPIVNVDRMIGYNRLSDALRESSDGETIAIRRSLSADELCPQEKGYQMPLRHEVYLCAWPQTGASSDVVINVNLGTFSVDDGHLFVGQASDRFKEYNTGRLIFRAEPRADQATERRTFFLGLGDLTISNCILDGQGQNVRAVRVHYGHLEISNTEIKNCVLSGDEEGAAVHLEFYATLRMTGGSITGCRAKNGGAVYANTSNVSISGTTVSNNSASGNGGGVYIWNYNGSNQVSLQNASFRDNTASGSGGAIYAENGATVSDCTFIHNTAGSYGGALYCAKDNAVLDGGSFSGNEAARNGNAVYADKTLGIEGCFAFESGGKTQDIYISSPMLKCGDISSSGIPVTTSYTSDGLDFLVGSEEAKVERKDAQKFLWVNSAPAMCLAYRAYGRDNGRSPLEVIELHKADSFSIQYIREGSTYPGSNLTGIDVSASSMPVRYLDNETPLIRIFPTAEYMIPILRKATIDGYEVELRGMRLNGCLTIYFDEQPSGNLVLTLNDSYDYSVWNADK